MRVRVHNNPRFHPYINCQFPRHLRVEGRFFSVPSLTIARGTGGTVFYRAPAKDIQIISNIDQLMQKITIYEEKETTECIVCFTNDKDIVFVPCGHFYCCGECYGRFAKKECPICRGRVESILRANEMKLD